MEEPINQEPHRAVLVSIREKNGMIQNIIDHAQFVEEKERAGMMPDVYFCFIIKSLVDDFGTTLVEASRGQLNKEQFEAQFVENLADILGTKTKL